jgi:hypothetical protein
VDRDSAKKLLRDALNDRAVAIADWEEARSRLDGTDSIIRGLLTIFPDLDRDLIDDETVDSFLAGTRASLTVEKPKGTEAVRTVLMGTKGKWFSVDMMVRDLDQRGWLPDSKMPSNAVRTALERLIATEPEHFHKDTGTKTGKVVYAYKPLEGAA